MISDQNNSIGNDQKYTIHTIFYWNIAWIIGILICVILCLLTLKLDEFNSKDLINGIVNFSTLLSIILSISSILFAYFTSQNTSRHFEEMSIVLTEVKQINNNIQSNNYNLISMIHQMALNVKSIDVKTQINENLSNQNHSDTLSKFKDKTNISNMKGQDLENSNSVYLE